jgi:AraC-like DNA-binding protein
MKETKEGSHKNIWYGTGRQRIEIPRTILKSKVQAHALLKTLHICSIGYYPKAKDHYAYRKKGLPENFIFFCVDGHGWFEIGGQRQEVGPHQFFILPQNEEHAYGSDSQDPWTIYWIHYGGVALPELNATQIMQHHFKPQAVKNNGEATHLFQKIYKTLELGYSSDNLLFANKMDCVDSAIHYMQQHIDENLTLNELASLYNYSVSRFSNLFRQKTGYAPIDYFVQLKMQKACQLLDFTGRSIKDIAFSMGFDDPYYFSKRFRTIIGRSPKKYREQNNT